MQRRTQKITAGLLVGVAFGLGTAAAGVTAASAEPVSGDCVAGATQISERICQIVIESTSEPVGYELPAGISKLSAVLVGGGGGGYDDGGVTGGGGAGQVVAQGLDFSSAPTTSATNVQISLGAGGIGNDWELDYIGGGDGGTTSLALTGGIAQNWLALGGAGATSEYDETDGWYLLGGTSGNGHSGTVDGAGGGAAGAAEEMTGGAGYDDFAALQAAVGPGDGLWSDLSSLTGVTSIGFGGDAVQGDLSRGGAGIEIAQVGSGGSGFTIYEGDGQGNDGYAGFAVLRYEIAQPVISLSAASVPQNGQLVVTVSGLDPNETQLTAEIHSNPVSLGAATANASGVATWTFNVPSNFQPGMHTAIVTRGAHSNQQLSAQFEVTAALAATGGPDLAVMGMLGGATVLAGAALMLNARSRRRA